MLNLNRLKASGLLMEGFDECLRTWLSSDQANPNPFQIDDPERLEVFNKLSDSVRQYYEIVHRWVWPRPGEYGPLAYRSTNWLLIPYYAEDHEWEKRYDLAECLYQKHGDWSAAISLEDPPLLYTENINDEPTEWKASDVRYDEFLVMVAFWELLSWADKNENPSTIPKSDDLVFSGVYWTTNFNVYYTVEDNRFWLCEEDSSVPLASATRTQNDWTDAVD